MKFPQIRRNLFFSMTAITICYILLESWLSNFSPARTAVWLFVFLVFCSITILIQKSTLPLRVKLVSGLSYAMGIAFHAFLDTSGLMAEWYWRIFLFISLSCLLAIWLGTFFRQFPKTYLKRLKYPTKFRDYLYSGFSPVLILFFIIFFLLFTSRWSVTSLFFFTFLLMDHFCEFSVLLVRAILQLFKAPSLNHS